MTTDLSLYHKSGDGWSVVVERPPRRAGAAFPLLTVLSSDREGGYIDLSVEEARKFADALREAAAITEREVAPMTS